MIFSIGIVRDSKPIKGSAVKIKIKTNQEEENVLNSSDMLLYSEQAHDGLNLKLYSRLAKVSLRLQLSTQLREYLNFQEFL